MDSSKVSFDVIESGLSAAAPSLALIEIADLELALVGGGIGDVVPA